MTSQVHVQIIAEALYQKGVRHAVFSPGSRSAPIVIALTAYPSIKKYIIPDERVAAYFAMGIAQRLQEPVVAVCTSGTAVLNFAPATCEAYYQKIPLLLLTADRPSELLNKGENQTINQVNVFANFIGNALDIQPVATEAEQALLWAQLNKSFETLDGIVPEPVHWNVHIPEPLYEFSSATTLANSFSVPVKQFNTTHHKVELDTLKTIWQNSKKIILIIGQMHVNEQFKNALLNIIAARDHIVLLWENTSNFNDGQHCNNEALFELINQHDVATYKADLIITLGRHIISKRLKAFFKRNPPKHHWHVSPNQENWDMFNCLTQTIPLSEIDFLMELPPVSFVNQPYKLLWDNLKQTANAKTHTYSSTVAFSDFKVMYEILANLPDKVNLQLGNSTTARYGQLFSLPPNTAVNCNRGTSGIDGCLSTAAGAAAVNNELTVCILGDISFFYDSNALWNNHLSSNLRIIIINNSGGNIFRMVDGAMRVNDFETFFETKHNLSAKHLASMFELPYYICSTFEALQECLPTFFSPHKQAAILEVKTNNEVSATVYKQYFEYIKNNQP